MQYRTLGRTGYRIAEVGFGTWQLADDPGSWIGADINESLGCLHRYVELGGNFLDTAWVYGFDDDHPDRHPSEELIGRFLRESGRSGDLIVATKVPPKNMAWPAADGVPISEIFPSEHIVRCVDDSLRSLGVDCLDLVQFHVWSDSFADEDGWKGTIERLTRAGKVRHWGLSINDYQPANCLVTLETGLIETVQFIFNIFHQSPADTLLPHAERNNIGLIARVPLDEGGLGGRFTRDTTFPDGDLRTTFFGGDRLRDLVDRTDRLKGLLGGEAAILPELALRYLLSFEAVSTVIPGMRRRAHVEANAGVSDGRRLSSALMEELRGHAWERNFYLEPTPQTPMGAGTA